MIANFMEIVHKRYKLFFSRQLHIYSMKSSHTVTYRGQSSRKNSLFKHNTSTSCDVSGINNIYINSCSWAEVSQIVTYLKFYFISISQQTVAFRATQDTMKNPRVQQLEKTEARQGELMQICK